MKYFFSNSTFKTIVLAVCFISGFFLSASEVYAVNSISGSDSATSSVGVALSISDIQIVGDASSSTPVKLVVTNGTLSITNTGGLSSLSGTTGSTITFTATVTDANTALATLTYTRGSVGTDTLEVSLVDATEVFFSGNGHLYEYIASAGDWNAAQTAAAAQTRYGATGYLTTITSQAENDFAAARLAGAGWMGASDVASEGVWRWVTGPEAGTQFWSGNGSGSTVGGNYANWANLEPNDSGGNEDCAQFLSGGSGQWNDLPCSGTSLPGYVVEFGATGDMPTVVAKNVSLATVNAPTADTLVPSDNATNVNGADNLTITFSEAVTVGTGTIAIYRASDDALIEQISASSSRVTGSGTTEIEIDPSTSLADSTEYYVQIAANAFKNASDIFYLGISSTSTWSFTTGDYTGPVFSSIAADPERTSVTLTWVTDEAASTMVVYGVEGVTSEVIAETDTAPRVTSHTVTFSGLEQCLEYSYRVIGVDGSSNTNSATSSLQTFTTDGCSSGNTSTRTASKSAVHVESSLTPQVPSEPLAKELRVAEIISLITSNNPIVKENPELVLAILRAYIQELRTNGTTASPVSNEPVRDLSLGMSGEDVRLLQELLIQEDTGPAAQELARVSATGYFGIYTKHALGEYQKMHGVLPYSGYFGVITRNQMTQAALQGLWW